MLADARAGWRMRRGIDRSVAGPFRAWWLQFKRDTVGQLPPELLNLPLDRVDDRGLAQLMRELTILVFMAPEPPTPEDVERFAAPAAFAMGDQVVAELDRLGMPDDVRAVLRPPGLGVGIAFEGLDIRHTYEARRLTEWSREGTDLIKTIPQSLLGSMPGDIQATLARGDRAGTLRRAIMHRYDVSEARVQLIVRDQLNKLNGQITQDLQTAAGIEEYIWRAATDMRVRDRHLELNGTRWRWDGPGAPEAGPYGQHAHPGQAIQCRCQAEAVVAAAWAQRSRPAVRTRQFDLGTGRPGRLAS
jgi:SPP1 gp7 family putative phage head morphogenesis protein